MVEKENERSRRKAATVNDNLMRQRADERDRAIDGITIVLETIEQQQREPDDWERVHLAHALSATFSGCYTLAVVDAQAAMTPREQRSTAAPLPHDPVFQNCDLALLRRALQAARVDPVQEFPHLGPVVLA